MIGFSGTRSAMKPVDLYAMGQLFPQYTGFSLTPGDRFSRTGSKGFVVAALSPSSEYFPMRLGHQPEGGYNVIFPQLNPGPHGYGSRSGRQIEVNALRL